MSEGRLRRAERELGERISGGDPPNNGVEGPRAERAQAILNPPLMLAAALTLPSVALSEAHVGGTTEDVAGILNWVIWIAFAVELCVMLAAVPDRRKYLRHHPVELIVVFLTPPVLPPSLQSLRAIRLLRLLRLLRLAQLTKRLFSGRGLEYAALMTLLTALAGGALFKAFEEGHQKVSEWESVYWAITTMTTLGSEWEPTTTGAEITAIAILLVGISFIAMLTGAIAQRFLNPEVPPAPGPAKAGQTNVAPEGAPPAGASVGGASGPGGTAPGESPPGGSAPGGTAPGGSGGSGDP